MKSKGLGSRLRRQGEEQLFLGINTQEIGFLLRRNKTYGVGSVILLASTNRLSFDLDGAELPPKLTDSFKCGHEPKTCD